MAGVLQVADLRLGASAGPRDRVGRRPWAAQGAMRGRAQQPKGTLPTCEWNSLGCVGCHGLGLRLERPFAPAHLRAGQ